MEHFVYFDLSIELTSETERIKWPSRRLVGRGVTDRGRIRDRLAAMRIQNKVRYLDQRGGGGLIVVVYRWTGIKGWRWKC